MENERRKIIIRNEDWKDPQKDFSENSVIVLGDLQVSGKNLQDCEKSIIRILKKKLVQNHLRNYKTKNAKRVLGYVN